MNAYNNLLTTLASDRLCWFHEVGIGYFPVPNPTIKYDDAYWQKYLAMDATPCGEALTRLRIDMVARHYSGRLLDVGIGGGRFVRERPGTFGCDVNPRAIEWLESRGALGEIDDFEAATFWDSFEHLADPSKVLCSNAKWFFLSIPIFCDPDHILQSHHYRKDEHFWYFTVDGLAHFMGMFGFVLREHNQMEQSVGRKDIHSFAFERAP